MMLATTLALAMSWQLLSPHLVTPGADIFQVVRLLGESPTLGCRPYFQQGWPDYKRWYFERNRISVVVDWKDKVISVRRER